MGENSKEKIARIKNEYNLAVHACNIKMILSEKREVIDHNIEALEAEIREETLKLHRDEANGNSDASQSGKLARNLDLLQSVKETRRQLDDKLDEYETVSEEMLQELQMKLIQAILEDKPQENANYQNLEKVLESESLLLEAAEILQSIFVEAGKLLEVVEIERMRVRRGWILSYLFGRNPNYAITSSLRSIAELAEHAISSLDLLSEGKIERADVASLSARSEEVLRKLTPFSTLRWGWRKIDREVLPIKGDVADLQHQWEKIAKDASAAAEEAAQALDAWLERNS